MNMSVPLHSLPPQLPAAPAIAHDVTIVTTRKVAQARVMGVPPEEFGIERLFLVSQGRRVSIASCLGPDEKASFAGALSTALSEAKRGPTRTVL